MKHTCSCGTEFEGKFCPNCGAEWQEQKTCPKCGTQIAGNAKFCNNCGYAFTPQPAPKPEPKPTKPVDLTRMKKLYSAVRFIPLFLLGLSSVLLMLFFLTPVAKMPGGTILGETIPSESYGNVYQTSNFEGSSLPSSLTALIVFVSCALGMSFIILLLSAFRKSKYKRIMLFGKQIFLRHVVAAVGYVFLFLAFIVSCVIFGQISDEDKGLGIFVVGAAPILTLIFTLVPCVITLACVFIRKLLRGRHPQLAKAEEKEIANAKMTALESWLEWHKKLAIVLSIILVIAIIIAVTVSVVVVNRRNGVYYAFENGQFIESDYYELNHGTWKDESGETGSYTLSGDSITLREKAFGSEVESIRGTLKDGVLTLNIFGEEVTYAKEGAVHIHEWGEWQITKEATCTENGEEARVCEKDNSHTETREIEALGHDMKSFPAREVTCSQDGYEAHNGCIRCGYSEEKYRWTPALHVKYEELENEVKVSGFSTWCAHTEIVLPSTYHGKPVTSIGYEAFKGCNSLESIMIPDSVTWIGSDAFNGCNSLTSITIPDSVTSIGSDAFNGCNSLTSITIPDSVTEIGLSVFEGTAYYNDESNWDDGVLYIGNHLIKAQSGISGTYTVKRGTKSIAPYAFDDDCNYKSIAIPDSVILISDDAFSPEYSGQVIFEGTVEEWKAMSGRLGNGDVQCSDGTIISMWKEVERESIRELLYIILPVVVGLAGIILLIVLLVRKKKKKARAQQGEDGKQENSKKKKRSKKTK